MRCFLTASCFFLTAIYFCSMDQILLNKNVIGVYTLWRKDVSQNIVTSSTTQQGSLMSCIFHCDNSGFISFYYFKTGTACLCSSSIEDNFHGHETEDTTLQYGVRTTKVVTSFLQVKCLDPSRYSDISVSSFITHLNVDQISFSI
jgi:hypothetical protein